MSCKGYVNLGKELISFNVVVGYDVRLKLFGK